MSPHEKACSIKAKIYLKTKEMKLDNTILGFISVLDHGQDLRFFTEKGTRIENSRIVKWEPTGAKAMSNKLGRIMWLDPKGEYTSPINSFLSYYKITPDKNGQPSDEFYERVHVLTPEELRGLLLNAFQAGIQAEISGPDFNHYAKELGL